MEQQKMHNPYPQTVPNSINPAMPTTIPNSLQHPRPINNPHSYPVMNPLENRDNMKREGGTLNTPSTKHPQYSFPVPPLSNSIQASRPPLAAPGVVNYSGPGVQTIHKSSPLSAQQRRPQPPQQTPPYRQPNQSPAQTIRHQLPGPQPVHGTAGLSVPPSPIPSQSGSQFQNQHRTQQSGSSNIYPPQKSVLLIV